MSHKGKGSSEITRLRAVFIISKVTELLSHVRQVFIELAFISLWCGWYCIRFEEGMNHEGNK